MISNVVDVAAFPLESVALQVTVVVLPTANRLPGAGEHEAIPVPSTVSEVVGRVYSMLMFPALETSINKSECVAMTGGIVSCTVIFPELVVVSRPLSVAVQVTFVVVPGANKVPMAGVQLTDGVPSSASLARPIAPKARGHPPRVLASTVMSFTVMVGGVLGEML